MKIGLIADLRQPINPLRRFFRVVAWQLRWAAIHKPGLLILVQLAAGLRTLLQGGVILLLRSGLSNPEQSPTGLIIAAIALLACASLAGFAFRLGTNRLAVLFETHVTRLVLSRSSGLADDRLAAVAFPGARFTGRSAAIAFAGVAEVLRALVLFVLAVFLDATLVLVVMALVAPTLLIQVILNRRVHRNAAGNKARAGRLRNALRATLSGDDESRAEPGFVEQPVYQDQLRGYERYLNTSAYAEVTGSVSIVIGIAFAAFWLFVEGDATSSLTGDTAARAVALILFLQCVVAVLRSIAGFTRLFSRSEAVYSFVFNGIIPVRIDDGDSSDDDI